MNVEYQYWGTKERFEVRLCRDCHLVLSIKEVTRSIEKET